MKKRIAVLLIVAMTVSMAGCKQQSDTSSNSANTDSSNSSASIQTGEGSDESEMPERLAENGFTGTAWLEDQSTPIVSEPITYTVMGLSHATLLGTAEDWANNTFFTDLTASTNIQFDFETIVHWADFTEKANLLLAAGDYPDIFFKANFSRADQIKYGNQEIFQDLTPYIDEYMPNLCGLIEEHPDILTSWQTQEGQIFSLGDVKINGIERGTFRINQVWLEEVGMEMPTTTEELYDVLMAFKTQDPNGNGEQDEIPLAFDGIAKITEMYNFFGIPGRMFNSSGTDLFLDDDGVIKYIPLMQEFKDFLKYANRLYEDGLMSADSFTATSDDLKAINSQEYEIIGMFNSNHQFGNGLSQRYPDGDINNYDHLRDRDYPFLTPLVPDNGRAPMCNGGGGNYSTGNFVITDKCEYPEPIMVMNDWFYTEEGGLRIWGGREGIDYAVSEEVGLYWLKDGEEAVGQAQADVRKANTIQPGGSWFGLWPHQLFEMGYGTRTQEEVKNIKDLQRVALPAMFFEESDSKEMSTIVADVTAAVDVYMAEVVTGKKDLDSSYDQFVTQLKNMGCDRLVEIYNETYQTLINQ